ncbi:MAG: hypothetical protein ACYDBJ_01505 [Aggregatilineales bacterium]
MADQFDKWHQVEIDKPAPLLSISQELEQAADVLNGFARHWTDCTGDPEKQNELLRVIPKRVYVKDRDA